MKEIKKLWEIAYPVTDEQNEMISKLCEDDSNRDTIVAVCGRLYAEGWKDYFLPFVGIGVALGVLIGRKIR